MASNLVYANASNAITIYNIANTLTSNIVYANGGNGISENGGGYNTFFSNIIFSKQLFWAVRRDQ